MRKALATVAATLALTVAGPSALAAVGADYYFYSTPPPPPVRETIYTSPPLSYPYHGEAMVTPDGMIYHLSGLPLSYLATHTCPGDQVIAGPRLPRCVDGGSARFYRTYGYLP